MTDMPSSYETSHTTTTTTTGGGEIGLRVDYIKTLPGILKIVEMVLCLITFICASVWWPFAHYGGGWVQFVAITAFVITLVTFLLYLFGVIYKIPAFIPVVLIEFIYYCVFTVFFLIASIVAAARGSWHSSIVATAIFSFAATAVFAVDTFLQFRAWRSGQTEMMTTTTTTHTTTTSTAKATVETREAY